jgi:xylulokinase
VSGLLIGVDVGTQSVKTGLFAGDGTCLAQVSHPLDLRRQSAEAVDQDPDALYAVVTETIAHCAADSAGNVAALAISGQMAGVLGVGADGRAVIPYDSWLDTRCRGEVQEISDRLGDELTERTGCPPMVAHAPKLLWWKRNRPAEYARVTKFLVPSAYVAGRLCGLDAASAFVDWTHLHFTGLADAARGIWSSELADELGLDLARLPRIVAPTELVGVLTADAGRACALPAGTPVAAGLGDTAAGVLGAGVVHPGQLLDTSGTAAVLGISTGAFRPDHTRTLLAMRGAVPGQWISLAYLAGGDLLRWLPGALGAPLPQLVSEAAGARPASLLFVPYLGGRILPADPHARGAWVGLDFDHVRADLARAVLESVAYEYAGFLERALELFPEPVPAEVRVIGGGKDDATWNRIKAAVLALPYVRLAGNGFACRGAALVAGAACGLVGDLATAAQAGTVEAERFEPDPALHGVYRQRLADYRAETAAREEILV